MHPKYALQYASFRERNLSMAKLGHLLAISATLLIITYAVSQEVDVDMSRQQLTRLDALRIYQQATAKAQQDLDFAIVAAREELRTNLNEALNNAFTTKNLEEANNIAAYLQQLERGEDISTTAHADMPSTTKTRGTQEHRITIAARIDGSDRVRINHTGATWEHLHWGMPTNVSVNGRQWNVADSRSFIDESLLPRNANLQSARVIQRTGRDVTALEIRNDELVIYFADTPNGASDYEIIIGITYASR